MSKIAILTIGYSKYAVPARTDIAAVLKALSLAESVDYTYQDSQKVFFPVRRGGCEISIEYIDDSQLRAEEPREQQTTVTPATLRLKGADDAS